MQAGGETQIRNNSRRLYGCNKPLSGGLRYDGRKHGHRPDERAGETGFEAYKDVYICYDGDKAGQAATLRGLDILKKEGLNVRVMSMPDEMDPDDLVRKRGAEAFEKALEAAVPLTDYKLECAWRESGADKVNGEEKKREAFRTFAKNAIAVLKPLDSVEQDSYLGLIRDRTGLSYDMLKRELVGGGSSTETADDSGVLDGRNAVAYNLLNFLTAEDRAMYFVLASCLMRKDYAAGCAVPRTDNPFSVWLRIILPNARA